MARHLSTGSFVKPIICKRQTRRPGKPQRLPRNGMNCIPLFITSGLVEMNLCFQDSSFFVILSYTRLDYVYIYCLMQGHWFVTQILYSFDFSIEFSPGKGCAGVTFVARS